jgi:hypothetical protein
MKTRSKILLLFLFGICLIPQFVSAQQDSRKFAWMFNPLGFIQFGPSLSAEFAVSPNTFVGPHIRFVGLGLLSHVISDNEESVTNGSFGLLFRQFLSDPSPRRMYIGGTAEFGWGTSKGSVGYTDEWKGNVSLLAFMGNVGHRWRFESGFFVNVGAFAGFALEIKDEWWEIATPNMVFQSGNDLYIAFMAEVSIGFEN